MSGEAWWCPACQVGVELGEAAWSGTLAPILGVTEPLHYECGTELVVNPDIGKTDEPAPAPPWETDGDAWKGGGS